MKNLNLCFFLFLLTNVSIAQPGVLWQKTLGGSGDDFATAMVMLKNGETVVAGHSSSMDAHVFGAHGASDIWVVNVYPFGEVKWSRALGGINQEFEPKMQKTADGGYGILGVARESDGDVSGTHGATDMWAVKLSPDGDLSWQIALGGTGYETNTQLLATPDGGFIALGKTGSFDFDGTGNHGETDLFIIKLSSSGSKEWVKVLGGSQAEEMKTAILTKDGGCLIIGDSDSSNGDVSGAHGETDIWVIKLSANGDLEWSKTLGGSKKEVARSILQPADGGYIIAGLTYSSDGDITNNHGEADMWIVKLSDQGELEWQKTLGGTRFDSAYFIQTASGDEGYIISGFSASNDGDVSGNHGNMDYWVVKTDNLANLQWQKCIGGSDFEDNFYTLKKLEKGGYILAGTTTSTNGDASGSHGFYDGMLIRISSSGNIVWRRMLGGTGWESTFNVFETPEGGYVVGCRTNSNDGDVSGWHGSGDYWLMKFLPDLATDVEEKPFPMQPLRLELFPSPASDRIFLEAPFEEGTLNIQISNLLGEEFASQTIPNGNSMDVSFLPNGAYFVTATAPSGRQYLARFVK